MISVVVPVRDEIATIGGAVEAIRAALESQCGERVEVVVVDDGSEDGSGAAATSAGARVLRHPQVLGYGRSIKDGVAAARYDTIAICDGDGTYDPGALPAMLAEFERGFDMVVGARRPGAGGERDGLLKRVGRWALRMLVEFTTGQSIPDVNSGLRVFSRPQMAPHTPYLSDGFSFTTSITLCFLMSRCAVAYVPAEYRPRRSGSKVRIVRDSLRTLQGVTQVMLVYNPLKPFLLLVGVTMAMSAGCALAGWLGWSPGLVLALVAALAATLVLALGFAATLLAALVAPRR